MFCPFNREGFETYRNSSQLQAAMKSIDRFTAQLPTARESFAESRIFSADAGKPTQIMTGLRGQKADLVMTDIPYSGLTCWQGSLSRDSTKSAIHELLESLTVALRDDAVVAMVTMKADKPYHESYKRLRTIKIGHRRVTFLELI